MSLLPQITCAGRPYEIGFAHGTQARVQIHRCLRNYEHMFKTNCDKTWAEVQQIASEFVPNVKANWPWLWEEMEGVSDGAQAELLSIVALNVRTEINFGLFKDGCTALSWATHDGESILAQNWDWVFSQRENLVVLLLEPEGKPRIRMVTEAGIIGKIGFNEDGVGVCLNAIRAAGMDTKKVPCHLGLRLVLESRSRDEAVKTLEKYGVASSCHVLVADPTGGVGLEWTAREGRKLAMNRKGQVFHSNHLLHPELEGQENPWLEDSPFRLEKIEQLCDQLPRPGLDAVQGLFKDETNYPAAICRKQEGGCGSETLFNIVMDLRAKKAKVILGRPVQALEHIQLDFA